MTQNIEQRTEAAVSKYEGASDVVDALANTDSTVGTGAGNRKSFPKLSREIEQNAQESLRLGAANRQGIYAVGAIYDEPNWTYTYNGQQWGLSANFDLTLLPYAATQADPNEDDNLSVYGSASTGYVNQAQGEVTGGSIYPEFGVLVSGRVVPEGTTHVRVKGGDFSSPFLMKLYRVGGFNSPASGSVSSINLIIKPYTATIGGITYYLTDPFQEEGYQNILSFFAVNDGNLLLNTGTDNNPMIQACVDTCAWNGGSPYVPTGQYKFLGALTARASKVNTFVAGGNDMLWRGDSMFLSTIFGEGQDLIDLIETKRFLAENLMIAGKGSLGTNVEGYSNLPTGRCFFSSQVDQENFSAIIKIDQVTVARCDEVVDAPRGTWLSVYNRCDFRFCNSAPSLDRAYGVVATRNNYICQNVIRTQAALVRTDFSDNHVGLGTWSAIFGLPEYTYDMAIGSLDFTKNYHETYSRMGIGSVVLDLRVLYGDSSKFTSNYFNIGQTSLDDMEAFRRFDGVSGLTQIDANTVFAGNVYTNENTRDKAFSVVDGSIFNIDILDDDLYCKTFADQIVGKTVIARNNFKFRMVMDITMNDQGGIDLPIMNEFISTGSGGENYTPDYRIMNSDGTLNMGLIGLYKLTIGNVRNFTIPAGKELYLSADSIVSESRTLLSNDSAYSDKNGVSIQRAPFVTPINIVCAD